MNDFNSSEQFTVEAFLKLLRESSNYESFRLACDMSFFPCILTEKEFEDIKLSQSCRPRRDCVVRHIMENI